MYPEMVAEIHGFKIFNFACYFWATNLKNRKIFKQKISLEISKVDCFMLQDAIIQFNYIW